jgi:hypothetical protein
MHFCPVEELRNVSGDLQTLGDSGTWFGYTSQRESAPLNNSPGAERNRAMDIVLALGEAAPKNGTKDKIVPWICTPRDRTASHETGALHPSLTTRRFSVV